MIRVLVVLFSVLLSVPVFASGSFGSLNIRHPSGITASVDDGVFKSLMERPANLGGGVALQGEFQGLIANREWVPKASRVLTGEKLATLSRGLAKRVGPVGLAWTLADLLWKDGDGDQMPEWMKPEEKDWSGIQGLWESDRRHIVASSPNEACRIDLLQGNGLTDGTSTCSSSQTSCGCYSAKAGGNMGTVHIKTACPAGQVYTNGSCHDPAYRNATDAEIEAAIKKKLDESPANALAQAAKYMAQVANGIQDLLNAADPISSTSGPATSPSVTTTKTSTGPEGTTTTTTTTQPNISYSNTTNIITITTITTTTITYPDGRTETHTDKDETDKDDDPDEIDLCQKYPDSAMCKPPVDICEEHPEAAICQPLGTVPDSTLDTDTVDVKINQEKTAAGSCPAPYQLPIMGKTYALSWEYVCTFADGIRPFVLIAAWLGAGLFVFQVAAMKSS